MIDCFWARQKKREGNKQPGKAYLKEHQANIYLHEANLWIERKIQERCGANRVSLRYADGEYAAEQPLGLPAVIAKLTRWAAQNLDISIGNPRRIPAI